MICTVLVGLILGKITGFVLSLFGTKRDTYQDDSDFILESEGEEALPVVSKEFRD